MDGRFIEQIKVILEERVKETMGDGFDVEVQKVMKTNDEILHGVTIRQNGENVSPTIYLDDYERVYMDGKPLSVIADEIITRSQWALNEIPDISNISLQYEDIKDKLTIQCVEITRNRERLKNMVHRPLGNGFTMTAHIIVDENVIGTMKTAVTREMVMNYGYDPAKVLDKAYENTVKKYAPVLMDLQDMVKHIGEKVNGINPYDQDARIESEMDTFILTNNSQMNGAGALFYPQIQRRIGEILDSDYYVLPTSLHEVMIVPDNGQVSLSELKDMVESINRIVVEPQEVLSDRVLRYDRERQRLFEPKVKETGREERSER